MYCIYKTLILHTVTYIMYLYVVNMCLLLVTYGHLLTEIKYLGIEHNIIIR